MLTKMLEEANALNPFSIPDQRVLQKMAYLFQNSTNYLFLSPEELHDSTQLGTRDLWRTLLDLQETKSFIKGQMSFLSQIAQRKTFQSLVQLALEGNQQAAKQVQELSGIMNQQDSNRTIVLHKIPRPEAVQ